MCLPLGATANRALVGSPSLANRKQAMVAVSSEVVTTCATAVKTLDRSSYPCWREK